MKGKRLPYNSEAMERYMNWRFYDYIVKPTYEEVLKEVKSKGKAK